MIRDLAQTGLKGRTVTPGATNIVMPAGLEDSLLTVLGVSVTAAHLLAGDTVAGTAGTMINKSASGTVITPSNADQAVGQGYTDGLSTSVKVAAVSFDASKLLTGTTVANTAGTMPENGATGGTITTQGGTITVSPGHTTGGTFTASMAGLVASVITAPNVVGGITGTAIPLPAVTAGTTVELTSTHSTTFTANMALTKYAEIRINAPGTYRVTEHLYYYTQTVYAQIYVNGVARTTLQSASSGTDVNFVNDLTLVIGDLVQAYAEIAVYDGFGGFRSLSIGVTPVDPSVYGTITL